MINRIVGAVVIAVIAGVGTISMLMAAGTLTPDGSPDSAAPQQETTAATAWLGARVVRSGGGVTVALVIADSPADKGGLQRGDVITSIDGAAVDDPADLRTALAEKAAGDSITLSITRDGSAQDLVITLEERPEALPIDNPIFPELNGIPRDELFSHLLGGSFEFTDANGAGHTATVELGTVTAVDASANTITVDLNSGDSKEYTITDGVTVRPDLSEFAVDDHASIVSVDGELRAITKGKFGFPFFGEGKRPGHGGHRFRSDGPRPFNQETTPLAPDAQTGVDITA